MNIKRDMNLTRTVIVSNCLNELMGLASEPIATGTMVNPE